jgi:N-acetyl-anhydromuramyl-L-alanine amidase AmpD
MEGQKYFSTPPLPITTHLADANHFTRGRQSLIRAICLHDTVGVNSLDWLSKTPGSNASVNRLIDRNGRIIKIVNDSDSPWTNGPSQMYTAPGSKGNQLSNYLTIELEHHFRLTPDWPEAQIRSCAWQVVEWWGFYGFIPVVYHWQVQGNKQDPINFPFGVHSKFITERLRECLKA